MPKFLEDDLRREGRRKGFTGKKLDQYVYGGMNDIGAMRGSKETAKGREMEKKHEDKMKTAKPKFQSTHITHHTDGSHTVEHHGHVKSTGKTGAFVQQENTSYSAGSHELLGKLASHLGIEHSAAPEPEPEEQDEEEGDEEA